MITTKAIQKGIEDISRCSGMDIHRVFDDFLNYIIHFFCINDVEIQWNYTKEETGKFSKLMGDLFSVYSENIEALSWYDAFGEIYEQLTQSPGQRSSFAQFFTPPAISDLLSLFDNKENCKVVGDPTAGSGRNLLAYNAKHLGTYMIAEDIDSMCCKMCALNFLIHGIEGEVTCHDSILISEPAFSFRINYGLNNKCSEFKGIPHIERISAENATIMKMWEQKKQHHEQNLHHTPQKKQLELF